MLSRNSLQCLSSNALKMIAIITMLIDHTAVVLIENHILNGPFHFDFQAIYASDSLTMWWNIDMAMRFIGRLAFPIFCFLIVEGFLHTRDVGKYARRLLMFAFLSEIPFDLAAFNSWFYVEYQNVYFTLFLGLLAIAGIQKYEGKSSLQPVSGAEKLSSRYEEQPCLWKQALVAALCCAAAWLLRTDYGAFGVFFIVLLYLCRSNTKRQTVIGSIALLWEITAPLAFIPIRMYNGTRGTKNLKWFFYLFYPVHLMVLVMIRAGI